MEWNLFRVLAESGKNGAEPVKGWTDSGQSMGGAWTEHVAKSGQSMWRSLDRACGEVWTEHVAKSGVRVR